MDAVTYSELNEQTIRWLTSDIDGRMPLLHQGKMPYGAIWRNKPECRYVDCVNGDDKNDGLSVAKAKQTIGAAMDESCGGDTIRVAPGVYGEMEGAQPLPWSPRAICARVVIRSGVTLESTDGAGKTFITGAVSTDPSVTEGWQKGIGPDAVRCVASDDGGALRGFTLTGGYTHANTADGAANKYGSAFYSRNLCTATIEDCIVSNNVAASYTIYQAVVRRCRVVGNAAATSGENSYSGAAGGSCAWYNSIIADNKGNHTIMQPSVVENCTLGDGNIWKESGASSQVLSWWDSKDHSIVNTAWLYGRLSCGGNLYCTNCLVRSETLGLDQSLSHNTIFTNAAAMKVDSEYRPILGSFAGIDRGDVSFSTAALGDVDIYGMQRIQNGALDIGAVEYDWRPIFESALGRNFTVSQASPDVTMNEAGRLSISSGEIAGAVKKEGLQRISFFLEGGSLAVYVGGKIAGEISSSGEQSILFRVNDSSEKIRLVFTPDVENLGKVVLNRLEMVHGFVISIK